MNMTGTNRPTNNKAFEKAQKGPRTWSEEVVVLSLIHHVDRKFVKDVRNIIFKILTPNFWLIKAYRLGHRRNI